MLQSPQELFSTKDVTVRDSSLNTSNLIFGAKEAVTVLTDPVRFTPNDVLYSINETYKTVQNLHKEDTKFIQSYFKEISETCLHHRTIYKKYMNSLSNDGKCLDQSLYKKLFRTELKHFFFPCIKHKTMIERASFVMFYRFLSGNIPWFVIGDEVRCHSGQHFID